MYALALVFMLTATDEKSEIIGVYKTLSQCEAASRTISSLNKCYFLDPEKGMVETAKAADTK
ncbi:TPA: hypothetical protein JAN03_24600 [Citrobacter freundii]|nr:hypothetical protein [Citrobacter freundii]